MPDQIEKMIASNGEMKTVTSALPSDYQEETSKIETRLDGLQTLKTKVTEIDQKTSSEEKIL